MGSNYRACSVLLKFLRFPITFDYCAVCLYVGVAIHVVHCTILSIRQADRSPFSQTPV